MLVSVCIPVIRPEKAQRCIDALNNDFSFKDFEIIAEEDTERIGCPQMLKKLVDKSNGDMICFLGDDTVPFLGLLKYAVKTMNSFPDNWGLVGFDESYISGPKHATHWLGHKKLLTEVLDGEFFHTGYLHCFCDNELSERAINSNRYKFDPRCKLTHYHPSIVKNMKTDEDYARVYSNEYLKHDQELFLKRRANGWK